jgi:hypothetical protein
MASMRMLVGVANVDESIVAHPGRGEFRKLLLGRRGLTDPPCMLRTDEAPCTQSRLGRRIGPGAVTMADRIS